MQKRKAAPGAVLVLGLCGALVLVAELSGYGAGRGPGIGGSGGSGGSPGGSAASPRGPRGAGLADFGNPLDGLPPDLAEAFNRGDAAFDRSFPVGEGLGPIFNNEGCEACH